MSKRALVLVEGQTEERFVKDVLAPSFWSRGLYLIPTLLVTKRVKQGPQFKGGITSYSKFRNDLERLLHGAGSALVTTLLDYYGLPNDFPGMTSRPPSASIHRVQHVERAIMIDIGNPKNFLPFLALHEFEAWLFSRVDILPQVLTESEKCGQFAAIRAMFASPEDINDNPDSAPSKRVESLFPAYRKTIHGPAAIQRIGLERVRMECPHFNWWVSQLEAFAS